MKEYSQDLSAFIDNELENDIVNDILDDMELQQQFSRYHLMGDVVRDEVNDLALNIDVTNSVMSAIADEVRFNNVVPLVASERSENNVTSLMKRFGQYAIAASVAGVVVVSSLVMNQNSVTDSSVTPVLNTIPFGAAAPVSLQTSPVETKSEMKERNERIEALLKDHQLQLQTQP